MTERPPGGSLPDVAQSTTGVPATATTKTPEPPIAAPVAAPATATAMATATATLATPSAGSSDNGGNTTTAPEAVSPQPAILPEQPPPQSPSLTSVRRQPRKERRPSQHQPSPLLPLPPPPPPQQQQQPPQPPPPPFHPYYSLTPETSRDRFYNILGELDPYRTTPKEFIHLLVHAATRDGEIAQALLRLNSDRINYPSTWRPPLPPNFAYQPPPPPPHFPSQPSPATSTPISYPPNAHTNTSAAPPPADEHATPPIHPRKRKRNEAAGQHAAPTPAKSRFKVNYPPPAPLSGRQGVPRPATTSTTLPIVFAQSVAPTGDANGSDKVIKPIDGDSKEPPRNYTCSELNAAIELRRLKSLDDGKWPEMLDLVTEANSQAVFSLLERTTDHLNSAGILSKDSDGS
ncbi:hypothetical protein CHU98_g6290 [Xylaria longipes]|nr:hypothetical protein CHU98_g6290 [Xylaria longipes]